jgi:fucose permease
MSKELVVAGTSPVGPAPCRNAVLTRPGKLLPMQPARRPPLRTPLLIISCLSFIAIGMQGGALGVAWLQMQDTFGRSLESLALLLLTGTFGGFFASFWSGRIVAATGIGWYCLIGALFSLTGLIAISVTPTWSGLIVATLILGVGRGAVDTGVNIFVAQNYSTTSMNWLHATFGVGSFLGPLLVIFLVITLSLTWQISYAALAAFQLFIAALFAITLRHWGLNYESKDQVGSEERGPSARESLKLGMVWLCIALFAIHTGLEVSAGQLTNNLFVEARGIDPGLAGLWIGFFWGFITIGRVIFGGLSDRLGIAPVLRGCTIGTVVGTLLLWWNPANAVSFLGLALMGLTLAPVFPSSVSRTPGLVGIRHSPNVIGFQGAGAALGVAVLPSLTGILGDRFGFELIPICMTVMALAQVLVHEVITLREQRRGVAP